MQSRLERIPTPYPKEMKDKFIHMRNLAVKQSGLPNGDVRTGTGPAPTSTEVRNIITTLNLGLFFIIKTESNLPVPVPSL